MWKHLGAFLHRFINNVTGPWKPRALVLCGLVILLCWPTLQAVSSELANDTVHYDTEPDTYARLVATTTNHALLTILAVFCVVIALGAIAVAIAIFVAEVVRQLERARRYTHRGSPRSAKQQNQPLPDGVTPINLPLRSHVKSNDEKVRVR